MSAVVKESALSECTSPVQASILRSSEVRHLVNIIDDVTNPRDERDRWIVDGVLPQGVTMLYGPSGCGKTGAAISFALSVASGQPWAGVPASAGAVLYYAAEDPCGVNERITASVLASGVDPNSTHLTVMPPQPDGMSLYGPGKLITEILGAKVRLVIVDTLSAAFSGEDQDRASAATTIMSRLNTIATTFRCAVLVVHHPDKNGSKRPTGSGQFFNRADAVLRAEKRADHTAIIVEKLRNGPTGARFRFEIGGFDVPTQRGAINAQIVRNLRPLGIEDDADATKKKERWDRTDADVAFSRLLEVSDSGNASLKSWKEACFGFWTAKKEGARRTAFSKAQAKLTNEGKVVVSGDTVTVTVTDKNGNNPVTNGREQKGVTVTVTDPPSIEGGNSNETPDPLQEVHSDG